MRREHIVSTLKACQWNNANSKINGTMILKKKNPPLHVFLLSLEPWHIACNAIKWTVTAISITRDQIKEIEVNMDNIVCTCDIISPQYHTD